MASEDPTSSKTLRRRYAAYLRAPYAQIATEIRRGVGDRDALGLEVEATPIDALAEEVDSVPSYTFESDARTHDEFMSWLERQLEQAALERVSGGENEHIRDAYAKGIRHADDGLAAQGINPPTATVEIAFNRGVHQDALELLYRRNYTALKGINDETSKQIGRTLSTGFAKGHGPDKMARELTDRVDTIGRTRATTMARTEVIHTHAESTLNRLEEAGVDEVTAEVEFSTAGDSRVCEICDGLEGVVLPIREARGEVPVHPQCRCAWLPVVNL